MKQIKKRHIKLSLGFCSILLGLSLNSCAIKKEPKHKTIITEAFVDATFIPNQWTVKTNNDSVNNNWLKNFNDPILDTIVAEAIRNNFDLKRMKIYVSK